MKECLHRTNKSFKPYDSDHDAGVKGRTTDLPSELQHELGERLVVEMLIASENQRGNRVHINFHA